MSNEFKEVRQELERHYQQGAEVEQTRGLRYYDKLDLLERNMVEREELIKEQGATIEELKAKLTHYEQRQRLDQARRFGQSSERTRYIDLSQDPDAEPGLEPTVDDPDETPKPRGKRGTGKREKILNALKETDPKEYTIPQNELTCGDCGGELTEIGADTLASDVIYVPAHYRKRPRKRYNYCCKKCGKIVHAPVPKGLFDGSIDSPSLQSRITYQKYVMGVPIDRLVKDMARDGLKIESKRVYWWTNESTARYIEPLVDSWHEELQCGPVAMIDDSYMQVNNEPGRKAQTKSTVTMMRTGQMAAHQIIVFYYFMVGSFENAMKVLGKFQGYLHSDGAPKLQGIPGIINVGCWQHVRHGFIDALKALNNAQKRMLPIAQGLRYIQQLFKLESEYKEKGLTAEERYQARLERSKPIADAFFEWCRNILLDAVTMASNEKLAGAVNYALNQIVYLTNVFLDGRLELSNNLSECMFIQFAIGRRNWRFADTPAGARANAALYSVVMTALANNVHPERYLEFLYEELPNTKHSQLYTLSPWSETLPNKLKLTVGERSDLEKLSA